MKEIKKEICIPARTVTRTIYQAIDGKQFDNINYCKRYEEQLNINNHPVVATSIKFRDFADDVPLTAYYIENEEDWKFFVNKICDNHLRGDTYYTSGEGWYFCKEIDGGDYHDYCNIYYAKDILTNLEKDFDEWTNEIHDKLNI